MNLPVAKDPDIDVVGVTKLNTHAQALIISWRGMRLSGSIVFGRKGWLGRVYYQALNYGGQPIGEPTTDFDKAALILLGDA